MKHFYLPIVAAIALCAAGCASNGRETAAQMPNPIRERSAEEIMSLLGVRFQIPDGAENVSYSTISDELAQMDFSWRGTDCNARILPSQEFTDISGMYYTWKTDAPCKIGTSDGRVKTATENGRTLGVCLWYDAERKLMHSVSMDANADASTLLALANAVYDVTM